jgi:hypothetical protein
MDASALVQYGYTEFFKAIDNANARIKATNMPFKIEGKEYDENTRYKIYATIPDQYWFNNYAKVILPDTNKVYVLRVKYRYTEISKTIDNENARAKATETPFTITKEAYDDKNTRYKIYATIPDRYWFNNYAKVTDNKTKVYVHRSRTNDTLWLTPKEIAENIEIERILQSLLAKGAKGGKNRRTKRRHNKKRQTKRRR